MWGFGGSATDDIDKIFGFVRYVWYKQRTRRLTDANREDHVCETSPRNLDESSHQSL